MKAQTTFALKERLVNPEKVAMVAARVAAVWPGFDAAAFERAVVARLPELELKDRLEHLAACLAEALPDDVPRALEILRASLPPELDPTHSDDDFGEFVFIAYNQLVARIGCSAAHLDRSLEALAEITKRASAEGAIRPFLDAFPGETLDFLERCARHSHYHVRRLASEGTRPLLPWAPRISLDPRAPLPILDLLHADCTRFVTRSVANHLNDLSKIEPDLVLERLAAWRERGEQEAAELAWIERHATRTLVKQGHSGALALLGYGAAPELDDLELVTSTPEVVVGAAAELRLAFIARTAQSLLIDYAIDFAGAEGGHGGRKVFKWAKLDCAASQRVELSKRHPLRPMTTRALHEGEHRVTVQVNGEEIGTLTFTLRHPKRA